MQHGDLWRPGRAEPDCACGLAWQPFRRIDLTPHAAPEKDFQSVVRIPRIGVVMTMWIVVAELAAG
nr:hypothetical protein [uncultured Sphingomonas sp.]